MKTRFIVNPTSGGVAAVLPLVRSFAPELGADVVLTTRRGHATELAAQALGDGCSFIVAVGGDGTLNEVAASLVDTSATFGLVPCGSGNGLGRHLGIHGDFRRSLENLRTGRGRLIDTGVADGHPFFTVAGLGFEAAVSARFNRTPGRGFFRYFTTSVQEWRRHVPEDCIIHCNGRRVEARAFTLAIANCDQYGNEAYIAPEARVDDGLLDVTLIPPVTALNALPLLAQLFAGSIGRARGVVRLQSSRVVIERPGPGLIHTDGETHEAGRLVEFLVRPRSLRVMAPPTDEVELLPMDPELLTLNS